MSLTALALLAQLALLIVVLGFFRNLSPWVLSIQVALSALVLLGIVASDLHTPEYKLAWAIPIMVLPIFAAVFYLLYGTRVFTRKERARVETALADSRKALEAHAPTPPPVDDLPTPALRQSEYLRRVGHYPAYDQTKVDYYPLGEEGFAQMLRDLETAEHYILFEYFIVSAGVMWDQMFALLSRKASDGVDVRVLYDDVGSLFTLPKHFHRTLLAAGIKVQAVNPIGPRMTLRYNNRNHRKILVIDGRVAFTGGINIADEYINQREVYGHWKDTVVRLEGPAAWSFAVMVLTVWDAVAEPINFDDYRPRSNPALPDASGWAQPFDDSPFDEVAVGLEAYLNIISQARTSVDIFTPYLIVDARTVATLIMAARSGVRVRIVTPHIGDSWLVHETTRSFYRVLVEGGVEVYEYTPGYVHAKVVVADRETAIVGTINFDYRSFYLHQECAVWLYRTPAIADIVADFEQTLPNCKPMTPELLRAVPAWKRLVRAVLRVFAPLM